MTYGRGGRCEVVSRWASTSYARISKLLDKSLVINDLQTVPSAKSLYYYFLFVLFAENRGNGRKKNPPPKRGIKQTY